MGERLHVHQTRERAVQTAVVGLVYPGIWNQRKAKSKNNKNNHGLKILFSGSPNKPKIEPNDSRFCLLNVTASCHYQIFLSSITSKKLARRSVHEQQSLFSSRPHPNSQKWTEHRGYRAIL